jgi:large subunit ribosomal protein L24
MSLKLKKGDKVEVTKGKDKGKSGKLLMITAEGARAVVEGLNISKKHKKRRSEKETAGIKEIPSSIAIANLALFCGHCSKGVRYGIKVMDDKTKIRVCKKCKQPIS